MGLLPCLAPVYGHSRAVAPLSLVSGASAIYALVRSGEYNGPCLRVVRASDSAEQDIGFNTSGFVDVGAARAFAGASAITVKTWYDQSGNGNDATQTTVGNQPKLNTEFGLHGFYGVFFGDIDSIFNGTYRYFNLPSGVSYNSRDYSCLAMVATGASGNIHPYFQNGPDAGNIYVSVFNRNTSVRPGVYAYLTSSYGFPVISPVPGPMESGFSFVGAVGGATNRKVYGTEHNGDGGIYTSSTANNAGTGTGGRIGYSVGASACFRGSMYAVAIYPSALDASDVATVKSEFERVWSPVAVQKTRALVFDGDSITEGYGATFQRNRTRLTYAALNDKTIGYYNMGICGRTADGNYQTRVNTLSYLTGDATDGAAVVLLTGINDIKNIGTSGTNVWNNYIAPYITYAVGLGYSVGVGTLIRNDNLTEAKETERQTLNGLIRANAAGLGAVVIDYDADSADITLPDGTHPNDDGYAIMSARELPAIRTMLNL